MAVEKAPIRKIKQQDTLTQPEAGPEPESLIHFYIQKCNEDGGYTIADLQHLALLLDIQNYHQMNSEVELIRAIQKAAHKRNCFRSDFRDQCLESECPWKSECKKIIAEWLR